MLSSSSCLLQRVGLPFASALLSAVRAVLCSSNTPAGQAISVTDAKGITSTHPYANL